MLKLTKELKYLYENTHELTLGDLIALLNRATQLLFKRLPETHTIR